jgi:hypothetical protein
MSDGTLRALGILSSFFQKFLPTLIAIEEPESDKKWRKEIASTKPDENRKLTDELRRTGATNRCPNKASSKSTRRDRHVCAHKT